MIMASYSQVRAQYFMDCCFKDNTLPISADFRRHLAQLLIELQDHPTVQPFLLTDTEENEVFELAALTQKKRAEGELPEGKKYYYNFSCFIKFIFQFQKEPQPQFVLVGDQQLSDQIKSEFLKMYQTIRCEDEAQGAQLDKDSIKVIRDFDRQLTKSQYHQIIKVLTRKLSTYQQQKYFSILYYLYDSHFLADETLIAALLPYLQSLAFIDGHYKVLILKIITALKQCYQQHNFTKKTKADLNKYLIDIPDYYCGTYKNYVESNQLLISMLNDAKREEGFAPLIWPLNDAGQTFRFERETITVTWPDMIKAQVELLPVEHTRAWFAVWQHAATAKSAQPSSKWLKVAKTLHAAVPSDFDEHLMAWMRLVIAQSPLMSRPFSIQNANTIRGMLWFATFMQHPEKANLMAEMVTFGYKKLAGQGPRAGVVANAALYVLGEMGVVGVTKLSALQQKIKYRQALAQISKMLLLTANRLEITTDDLEDLAVPEFKVGLDQPYQVGEYQAHMVLQTVERVPVVVWSHHEKVLAAVTAKIKKEPEYKSVAKQLTQQKKELVEILKTQSQRLENSFLCQRTWSYAKWQTHLINHQLLGWLSRRLIWQFETDGCLQHGFYTDGQWRDLQGRVIQGLTAQTIVRLWHPIFSPAHEVLAWRQLMIHQQVVQPFKQAFREVYVVTPAEIEAKTQSLRYAGHYLKQTPFHALCQKRQWSYHLQGGWDCSRIAQCGLGQGLSVSIELEAHDGPQLPSGVFVYAKTKEILFYRDHTAASLETIPPVIFSEVMRDLDLFVASCSMGTEAIFDHHEYDSMYEYWLSSRTAELTASAHVRRDTLDVIISKLAIAPLCRFEGKYLHVTGQLRDYKIHLGSGNILMSPNDQYLCIVADHKQNTQMIDEIYLPFEGDQMLSLILSKALLLAADDQIKDRSIVQQIQVA